MSEFEIRIPARKKQPATDKDNPVVKVSTVAYNALVEIYNESTLSMKDIASLLIIEGSNCWRNPYVLRLGEPNKNIQ